MADRVPHYIVSEGGNVGIILPDTYDSIGSVVGVNKVTDSTKLAVTAEVDDLKQSGVAIHLRCRVDFGGTRKTRKILCSMKEASSAVGQLIGKNYDGGTIKSASIKRDRILK